MEHDVQICSIVLRRVKICSFHERAYLQPACSSLSFKSIAVFSLFKRNRISLSWE